MDDAKKQQYDAIAHQIDREDSLINYRLTWTLTLNGFLFAALGFLVVRTHLILMLRSFFIWHCP